MILINKNIYGEVKMSQRITIIEGDGIGREVMKSVIELLSNLRPDLIFDYVPAGLENFEKNGELLPQKTLESILKNKIFKNLFFGLHWRTLVTFFLKAKKLKLEI